MQLRMRLAQLLIDDVREVGVGLDFLRYCLEGFINGSPLIHGKSHAIVEQFDTHIV